MKKAQKILCFLLTLVLMLSMTVPVLATEKESMEASTEDPRDSILQIYAAYEDDGGTSIAYQAGTCFLINDEYVLTNAHVITMEDASLEKIKTDFNLQQAPKRNDSHIKYYVLVNRDMKIPATPHESVRSDDMDFVAMKLSGKIYDRAPVVMGDSSKMQTKDEVFAMGFPANSLSTKDYNTKEDVSTVGGNISKITETGNVDIFEHTAQLDAGNSGGPLLNSNNEVVGINVAKLASDNGGDSKSYSIQINHIKNALDTFGIPYYSETKVTIEPEVTVGAEPTTEPDIINEPDTIESDNTELLGELQDTISTAKTMDRSGYTKESIAILDKSIADAELVKETASEAEIQNAIDDVNSAIDRLEVKTGPNIALILGIVAIVIVIIIIIIVIIIVTRKPKEQSGGRGGYERSYYEPQTSPSMQPTDYSEADDNTALLDSGDNPTTLLGGATAYLIRTKNGERIKINSNSFILGRERKKVNYCVSDNTSVSKAHLEIRRKGSDFYAVDLNSTNYTYLNGSRLIPNQETLLMNGSQLKLSDEEFEFHLA